MTKDAMMRRIGYREAVARQPEALETTRAAVSETLRTLDLSTFEGKAIGLAGIGASYQAALAGASFLRARGRRAFAFCSTDLYEAVDAADAFVALSASGQSKEIAEVMQARSHLPRLAICRGTDNPLAAITGAVIGTQSGDDNGASSTGYTSMLLAIGQLADRLVGEALDAQWADLPGTIAKVLASSGDPAKQAADLLASRSSIDLVGAGAGFATAGEGAMLIREAVRIPAAGWDTLNYLHGPMESQDGRTGLIAFGNGREAQIAVDVAAFGCPSVLITNRTDIAATDRLAVISVPSGGNEISDAIVHIVAAQLIVGEMQDAAGLADITFRYRQTDTKLKPWSPTEV
ncbi:SIS domain-containing protein [Labrys miyagiensis]|nr:sugar isomerase [Labrys miyagiensis]